FMPIITARYFEREWCRQELEWFIAREQSLGRDDLILPIYFIDSDRFEELKRQGDELANAIANHQLVDLREHRQKMRSAAAVRDRHIEELARRLLDALKRIEGLDVPETTPGGDARAPSVLEDVGPGGGPESELEKRADTSVAETGQTAAPPRIRADASLAETIAAAEPGSEIVVPAGVYPGGITIDKPDRKSTRLNSSHQIISYPVLCL